MSEELAARALAFNQAFDELCDGVVAALSADHEYGDTDVLIVIARALEKKPNASRKELAGVWAENFDLKVDRGLIDAICALHACFGGEWPVFLFARHNSRDCFMAGASTARCIAAATEAWEDWCSEFDERRAAERTAAMRWIKRQAKKSA